MLLTIDIGNTNIVLGGYDEDELSFIARLKSDISKTSDQYAIDFLNIITLYKFSADDFDGAIISSVVPSLASSVKSAIEKAFDISPMILGPGVKTGLNIKIDNPAQLGADLVAGAVAVINKYPLPAIIYDFGTATTMFVVDEFGNFLGGSISAGVGISLDALSGKTAVLPMVNLEAPKNVIGTNTIDSMKSGLVLGTAAMVDGMTDRILEELKTTKATLIATGGLAKEIIKHCKYDIEFSDTLLLEGLKIIYNKNK
jgi:type III pantothenate kinase